MDASHVVVGGLTAISFALLVWVEIRSRRNAASQETIRTAPVAEQSPPWADKKTPGS